MKLSEIFDWYITGKKEESIFFEILPSPSLKQDENRIDLMQKIGSAGDDRSRVLLIAMVAEYYIDKALTIVIPGYKTLTDDTQNFTFSTKIKLLSSLKLVPNHITQSADLIRKARNSFAHDLNVETIEDIDERIINKMRALYISRKIGRGEGKDDLRKVLFAIEYMATHSLNSFCVQLEEFSNKIRSSEFYDSISENLRKRNQEEINAIRESIDKMNSAIAAIPIATSTPASAG